jgi:hypothetical protein
LKSYRYYSSDNPIPAEKFSDAGFFFEGPGDKVRCFWCNGALELWEKDDEPWIEHAKWYPGCYFLRLVKRTDFIIDCRRQMSEENVVQAKLLHYNDAGTDFLERVDESEASAPASKLYKNSDWFVVCKEFGFSEDAIVIDDVDFNRVEIATVIDLMCF